MGADEDVPVLPRGRVRPEVVLELWPEVEIVSVSTPMTYEEYTDSIGDEGLVIDMLVGALQRLLVYPEQGFMISQVPTDVLAAYDRLSQGDT